MSDQHWTLCPVVRDEVMSLFECVSVGTELRMVPFRQRILWVRESESKIVLRHDAIEVNHRATLSDYYGYLTSLESAVTEDAASLARKLSIGIGDRLAVEVDLTIRDAPFLPDNSDEAKSEEARMAREYPGKPIRKSLLNLWGGANPKHWYTSDQPVSKDGPYPRLEAVTYLQRPSIYSTRTIAHKPGEMPEHLSEFIEQERAAARPYPTESEVR